MSELAQRGLAFAVGVIAMFGGAGLFILCLGLAVAATTNARARLQEAHNAARTLSEAGGRADE